MIKVSKEFGQMITELDGTAVIKNEKMIGKLTKKESVGLTWLLDQVEGGSVTVELDNSERVGLEIIHSKTKFQPHLQGNDLNVAVDVTIDGTLGDNITPYNPTEDWLKQVEKVFASKVQTDIQKTLNKLQKDLKTDITKIGIQTYRKYPQEWKKIRRQWDEVFSNASITINVNVNIEHQGLIQKSIQDDDKKPSNIPFPFFK